MKTVTFKFFVGTRYVGSEVKDDVDIEFEDDATDTEMENEAEEQWKDWLWENIDGGWVKADKV